MGRVWSSTGWTGFLDIAAMTSSVADSISRLWISLLQIPASFQWSTGAASIGSSASRWWPPYVLQIDFSAVESVLWSVVVAVESVVLVSLLCFFFLFCGCSI